MSRTLAGRTVARRARTPARMTEGQKITELGSHSIGSSTTHHIFSADRESILKLPKKKIVYENHTPTILAHKMEESFHERLETARTKLVFGQIRAIVAFLITTGTCIYFYLKYTGEQQKERISKTASDIGRGALSNQELVEQANKLSLNIVHGVLNDPKIRSEVTRLLSDVVQSGQVTESSLILVNKILNDPNIQQSVGVLLHDQLLKALANEEIKLAVQELVKDVFLSESITETVRKVLGDAVSSDYVKSAAALAGTEATQAIIADQSVQDNLSDAIYGALKPWRSRSRQVITPSPARLGKKADVIDDTDTDSRSTLLRTPAAQVQSEPIPEPRID